MADQKCLKLKLCINIYGSITTSSLTRDSPCGWQQGPHQGPKEFKSILFTVCILRREFRKEFVAPLRKVEKLKRLQSLGFFRSLIPVVVQQPFPSHQNIKRTRHHIWYAYDILSQNYHKVNTKTVCLYSPYRKKKKKMDTKNFFHSLQIVHTYCTPCLPSLVPTISKTNSQELQTTQNKVMKTITGIARPRT